MKLTEAALTHFTSDPPHMLVTQRYAHDRIHWPQAPVRRAVNVLPSVDHQKTAMKARQTDPTMAASWSTGTGQFGWSTCLCASCRSTRRRRHDGGGHAVNRATRSMDGRHAAPHRIRKHGRARSSRQVGMRYPRPPQRVCLFPWRPVVTPAKRRCGALLLNFPPASRLRYLTPPAAAAVRVARASDGGSERQRQVLAVLEFRCSALMNGLEGSKERLDGCGRAITKDRYVSTLWSPPASVYSCRCASVGDMASKLGSPMSVQRHTVGMTEAST